jgi:hypothetical protein
VSDVGRAVALLAEAVKAGGRGQRGCSAADEHARTMLELYTEAAEDSGHDAPQSAMRQVSDAQECLLEAANRIHRGAEALNAYVQDVAPDLAGAVTAPSAYRPSGSELLDLAQASAASRSPRARRTDAFVRRRDDMSDAATRNLDAAEAATQDFGRLPDPPGPSSSVAQQPMDPSAHVTNQGSQDASAGHGADALLTVGALVTGWRTFWRRVGAWRRSTDAGD